FNGSTQLVGSVRSQQDIRFNGHITVQAEQGSPVRDTKAPTVTVELVNDTGVSDSDRITSNINMQGRVHDNREVVGLLARFADSSDGEFVDVSSNLQPNGRFSFSAFQLEEMKGDSIAPGQHSLQLIAQDSSGNLSAPVQLSFILEGAPQDPEDSQRDSSSGDGQNSGENLGGENSSGSSNPSTPLPFTITAERTIHINQGGDFDGAPDNLTDDAFIYAGRGYTINSRPEIAVERDVDSNPVLDEFGLPVLRDRALAVSSDHGQINAPTDLYSELRTPQVVDSQTVTVPTWNQLRDEQLSDLPHSIRTVQRLSGLNSISDWNQAVPSGSSPDNLTYLRIQQGGLTIPGGAELRNAVVIVDSGTININGDATFENVVLMVNQGNVNLKGITASNLEVYASDAINVNSQASFEGNNSLVAGRHIHFNGHAQTVDTDDYLKVVANGNLTFNSSADIHADLLTGNDFKSNQATTLYGTLGAKRNIHFNAYIKVFGKSGVTDPQTNQAPTDIALDRDEIAENSVGGVDIGQLSTTDPDTGDTHTYTLVDNPEGLFVIDADRLQLAAN
ncbi:MAG: cadherin repeat domain-containing protein, partial [Cyanobacteria bacterium J06555_12]